MDGPCPCGSGLEFDRCCGPLIRGAPADTPQALMRSRYTAYVVGDMQYLAATQDRACNPDFDPRATARWNKDVVWKEMRVLAVSGGGAEDTAGTVEFQAFFEKAGRAGRIHEISRFEKKRGRWLYFDGQPGASVADAPAPPPAPKRNKTGRNEPCPCGSGKKYKRCCGG
jgi:SEC-C motif-containing protein